MRLRVLAIAAAPLAFTLVACGDGETAQPTFVVEVEPAAATADGPDLSVEEFDDYTGESTVEVDARDNNFIDPYIEVSAGTEIDFTNVGRNDHNVLPVVDGAFGGIEAEDFVPGDGGAITLTTPGDYAYYCSLHGTTTKGMVGAIRVLE